MASYPVRFFFAWFLVNVALGQTYDFEQSRVEITNTFWRLQAMGTIRSGGFSPIDLESDLRVSQNRFAALGKMALHPRAKHRINIEGTPYRLQGVNELSREVTFRGRTYSAQDQVTSSVDLIYVYGGYQYDLIQRPQGHAGFQVGAAYFNADTSILSVRTNRSVSYSRKVGVPLVGGEFRVFPVSGSNRICINGEVKGISLGRDRRFIQGGGNVGVRVGPVTLLAGYMMLDLNARDSITDGTVIKTRFSGPAFSVQFRDK
jgi:hypothetical protein